MIKLKIKSGDTVKVITGKDKGKEGKVVKVLKEANKAIVEGINMVTKHVKPNASNPQGGINKQEAPIHISNIALVDPSTKEITKVGYKVEDGKKIRVSKKTNKAV